VAEELTHLDEQGRLKMVDIGGKQPTARLARVRGEIRMARATTQLIAENKVAKGNVLEAARLAGIMAAKRTPDLIPLCHPLQLTWAGITFNSAPPTHLSIVAECRVTGATGVEMEALTAASIAALTVYDMCKSMDRSMSIGDVRLRRKEGGKSGVWQR